MLYVRLGMAALCAKPLKAKPNATRVSEEITPVCAPTTPFSRLPCSPHYCTAVKDVKKTVDEVTFEGPILKQVQALFDRYPQKIHALLPVLHLAQQQNQGWLSPAWLEYVADQCDTTLNHVRGVVTFYNMFKTSPVGKNHIMVCTSLPCGLCHGADLLHGLETKLGIMAGETTEDGMFSLEEAQCLAACDQAPMMLVNDAQHHLVDIKGIGNWVDTVYQKEQGNP